MKLLSALIGLILTAFSLAVFDLQQVTRYNPSAPVESYLLKAIPKVGGGFYAFGELAGDVLLTEFDQYGGLVRSQYWDAPAGYRDRLVSVGAYPDGSLFLAVNTAIGVTYLLKYSPVFSLIWEKKLSEQYNLITLDGAGNAYVATSSGVVVSYDPSGTVINGALIPNMLPDELTGLPGGGGVFVGGWDPAAGQAKVVRLLPGLAVLYSSPISSVNPSGYVTNLVANSTGAVIASCDVGSSSHALVTLTPAGVGATIGSYKVLGLKFRGANQAMLTRPLTTGVEFCIIALSNGSILVSSPEEDGITCFEELTGVAKVAMATGNNELLTRNANGGGILDATLFDGYMREAVSLSATRAALVGNSTSDSAIAINDNGDASASYYRFIGGPERVALDTAVAADGSLILAVREITGIVDRLLMLRYRTNGTLMYAREVSFGPNAGPTTGRLAVHSDGSVSFLGTPSAHRNLLFARLSATGAVLTTRSYPSAGLLDIGLAAPLENGATALFNRVGDFLQYTRMGPSGQIEIQSTFTDTALFRVDEGRRMPNGNFAIASRTNTGVQLRGINPTTGVSIGSHNSATYTTVTLDLDPAGNPVTAQNGPGGLLIERRSAANIANLLNARTVAASSNVVDMDVSPNGNTVVLTQETGDDKITWFGTGGFATVASATIASTVTTSDDLVVAADNVCYFLGNESVGPEVNSYAARYLATGVRSAQRRTAGRGQQIHAGSGVWISGSVPTRRRGVGPFVARYSL